jgi:hypothetical protein
MINYNVNGVTVTVYRFTCMYRDLILSSSLQSFSFCSSSHLSFNSVRGFQILVYSPSPSAHHQDLYAYQDSHT